MRIVFSPFISCSSIVLISLCFHLTTCQANGQGITSSVYINICCISDLKLKSFQSTKGKCLDHDLPFVSLKFSLFFLLPAILRHLFFRNNDPDLIKTTKGRNVAGMEIVILRKIQISPLIRNIFIW